VLREFAYPATSPAVQKIRYLHHGLLAVKDRIRVAPYARRHNPNVRIIVLYRGSIDNAEMADAVLNAAVDPQDLLQALQELLTGAPKRTG